MGKPVNLDKKFVELVHRYAKIHTRSVPKQIEYWAKIGRIAEENPDLCYEDILGILHGMEEAKRGDE